MNKLLLFLLTMCVASLEAATITNWGSQLPTAAPAGGDIILMQKGGVTYYFTPNQLAANIATNAQGGIANKISNLNGVATNTTFYGIVTGATVRATNIWDESNVKYWGAVGDGVTDDTAAISNAIAGVRNVHLPAGTNVYKVQTLWLSNDCSLVGVGGRAVILGASGIEGWVINAVLATNVVIENLTIIGPDTTDYRTVPTFQNRHGVMAWFGTRLHNLHVSGFKGYGVNVAGNSGSVRKQQTTVSKVTCVSNDINFLIEQEYVRISDCQASYGYHGVKVDNGNVLVDGCVLSDNAHNAFWTGAGNNGHGILANSFLNHATINALWCDGINYGLVVAGCSMMGSGDILITNSWGVDIQGCAFGINNILVSGGPLSGTNWMRNCWSWFTPTNNLAYGGSAGILYFQNMINNASPWPVVQTYFSTNYFANPLGVGTNSPEATLHLRPSTSGPASFRLDDTNGTPRVQFGVLPGDSSRGAFYVGNVIPTANNYLLFGNATSASINSPSSTTPLYFSQGDNIRWYLASGGDLIATFDDTLNVGSAGANRPQNIYVSRNIVGGFLNVTGQVQAASVTVTNATNQIVFGATNVAPVSAAAPTKWVSVRISGDSGVYRLPLYE